jgi:prolyl oligopeptidase
MHFYARVYARAILAGAIVVLAGASPERPPAAGVDRDVDVYFGKPVPDPYRWMETPSAELDTWAAAQNAYARAALAAIPGRDALRRHMDDIAGKMTVVTQVIPVGHRIFFRRKAAGDDLAMLMTRDTDTGQERLLLDPNRMTENGHHVSIDQFQPSQDGHYVAVGLSAGGSEEDVLSVLDADTGTRLPDRIDRARFASPSWLPDGRSFFYNRLRVFGPHQAPSARFSLQNVYIHHLGGDPAMDVPVFGAGIGSVKTILSDDFVAVAAVIGTRYALGVQSDGVLPELSLYIAKIPSDETDFSGGRLRCRPMAWSMLRPGATDCISEAIRTCRVIKSFRSRWISTIWPKPRSSLRNRTAC